MIFKFNYPSLMAVILFATLSLASLSTKAAGAAWLALVIFGLMMGTRTSQKTPPHDLEIAAQVWLCLCLLALLIRSVPVVYWSDLWEEQHGPLRLLLGALGVWGLTRSRASISPWALHGLAVAGVMGLGLTLLSGRDFLPTNAIPWSVGLAMISLLLMHSAVLLAEQPVQRMVWGVGAGASLSAVLVSGTRGAYGVVVWAALWLLWNWRAKLSFAKLVLAVLLAMMVLFEFRHTPFIQTPINRVQVAVTEFRESQLRKEGSQNSSVGARVELWSLAVNAIPESIWLGHGREERLRMIAQWGENRESETVTSLGHMHNQFLHDLVDHGVWGLASSLVYLFGLIGLAFWLGKRRQSFAGWTLGSVAFMHASASMTNVNFAHNFYPVIMSIVVVMALTNAMGSRTTRP